MTDADQTLQPATDKVGQYDQLVATPLTAARNKTIGVTSATAGAGVQIVRRDTGAFNMTITNGGTNGGTLATVGAAPTGKSIVVPLIYNGSDWLLGSIWYGTA
jgi:hypothetical protein